MPRHLDSNTGRAAARRQRFDEYAWTADESQWLTRACTLRSYGAQQAAMNLVAEYVRFPATLYSRDVLQAVNLDVALWYTAYVGHIWDGTVETVVQARTSAHTRLRNILRNVVRRDLTFVRAFRSCHLLTERIDRTHPEHSFALDDYTTYVGWPSTHSAGYLQWDNPNGIACCFCGALLLDSECRDATGAAGMKCGKACCQEGQVDPPPMPEWPVWLVTLWMGRTGRDHGADGLMRSAMRKYSRQLHNALSLSSQVTTYACVRIVHEIPCHISISCLSHT
jgi:hypothetical protein